MLFTESKEHALWTSATATGIIIGHQWKATIAKSVHCTPPSPFHLSHRRWPWVAPAFHSRVSPWDFGSSLRLFQPATIVELLYMSNWNLCPPLQSAAHGWDGFLFCSALWGLYDLVEAQPSLFYLSGLLYRLTDHQAFALINKSVRSTQGPTRPHFIYTLWPREGKDGHGEGNKEEWKMRSGHEMTEEEECLDGVWEGSSTLTEAQASGEKKHPIQQASARCSLCQMCPPPG